MSHPSNLFPPDYETSRARFRASLARIQQRWPNARLITQSLDAADDLTLDWIEAPAVERNERGLIFTLGEHGIEAYAGSAMLEIFLSEFSTLLNPATTGLLLVHAINPWGMKHRRRVNCSNVDPNRNFVSNEGHLSAAANPDYANVDAFLNPAHSPRSWAQMQIHFAAGLVGAILRLGMARFQAAVLLGQYRHPLGIYYGGKTLQPEVQTLQMLFQSAVAQYERILLLDMHTGYGPRYLMSIVNSALEPRTSDELKTTFAYPNVVKTNPNEFYAIQGDMIDYLYTLVNKAKPLYATTFEFGTFGDSTAASLRSLRATIFENWLSHHPTANPRLAEKIHHEFAGLYLPEEPAWRDKAVADARQAFSGILKAEGYIQNA